MNLVDFCFDLHVFDYEEVTFTIKKLLKGFFVSFYTEKKLHFQAIIGV